MTDNPNTDTIGEPIHWTDEDINRLVGIDEDGNVSSPVLVAVLNDAGRYPELFAAITAQTLDDNGVDDGTP